MSTVPKTVAGSTPVYHLRWPDDTAPADVPLDIKNLATDTEAALAGKQNPTTIIHHVNRNNADLPPNPYVGQRILVQIAKITVSGSPEQVNEPWWEMMWTGTVWKVTGGTPLTVCGAAPPATNGIFTGNNTWQQIGPSVYCPYSYMRTLVRSGTTIGSREQWAVATAFMLNYGVGSGLNVGWPTMQVHQSIASVTNGAFLADWGMNAENQYMQLLAGAPEGHQYEISNSWLEIMPVEIGTGPGLQFEELPETEPPTGPLSLSLPTSWEDR